MQERYRGDPWALLVGCILFNMVHGKKAQPIHEEFLRRWPTPEYLLWEAKSAESLTGSAAIEKMATLFKPLGFQNRRAERIWKMTWDFRTHHPDWYLDFDVRKLHGIGKYGADSFNIFCRGYLVEDVTDKELRAYVDWALLQGAGGVVQEDDGRPPETRRRDAEEEQPGSGPGRV